MRVGNYTIPNMRLVPKLVGATKTIYETYSSEEISDMNAVAQLLGHKSARSGTFLQKMTFLRAYGLIEGRGAVRVSEVGKKITYGTDQEKAEAIKKAILNIPLWKELFARYSIDLPKDNFWAVLSKITGLEPPRAQIVADYVQKAYLDDTRYIKVEKKPEEEPKVMEAREEAMVPFSSKEYTKIETEDFTVYLKRDPDSFEMFESFDFKSYLEKLKGKMQKENKS